MTTKRIVIGLVATVVLSLAATFLLINAGGGSRGLATTPVTTTTP